MFLTVEDALKTDSVWAIDTGFYQVDRVKTKSYSIQAILDRKLASYELMESLEGSVDDFFGANKPQNFKPCAVKCFSGRGSNWDGYVMYELTEELLTAIEKGDVDFNEYYDTLEDAERRMSERSVHRREGDSFTEVVYIETEDFPKELKDRDGQVFPALKGWVLDEKAS